MIISGFPGVGKSTIFDKFGSVKVSDSDSSKFDKSKFPLNYLNHIMMVSKEKEIVMVSSHEVVRKGLVALKIPFTLVYPHSSLKSEYLDRYKNRGSPESFVSMMENNWDSFIDSCEKQTGCKKIVLQAGQFLIDVI